MQRSRVKPSSPPKTRGPGSAKDLIVRRIDCLRRQYPLRSVERDQVGCELRVNLVVQQNDGVPGFYRCQIPRDGSEVIAAEKKQQSLFGVRQPVPAPRHFI